MYICNQTLINRLITLNYCQLQIIDSEFIGVVSPSIQHLNVLNSTDDSNWVYSAGVFKLYHDRGKPPIPNYFRFLKDVHTKGLLMGHLNRLRDTIPFEIYERYHKCIVRVASEMGM